MAWQSEHQPRALTVRCPAKINLHLRVAPPRTDGFHPLLSWMCTVGLFDSLTLETAPAGRPAVSLTCDDPSLPTDEKNLVVRIVNALARSVPKGVALVPLSAHLSKRIPAGAGLGGGSSDAACALLAASQLWRSLGWEPSRGVLADVAGKYGSDIPFFFHGPSAACSGRGEVVRSIARPKPRWVVLLLPAIHMPTPDVYHRFDALHLGDQSEVETEPEWLAWSELSAIDLLPRLVNDLEPAAFAVRPDLAELRAVAEQVAGRTVRMSGSGSSLFTLADEEAEAKEIVEKWSRHFESSTARLELAEVAPEIRLVEVGRR